MFYLLKYKPREIWFQIKVMVLKTLKNEGYAISKGNSCFDFKKFCIFPIELLTILTQKAIIFLKIINNFVLVMET